MSFATHSSVSSISSHTACYLTCAQKQLATEIANRRQGGLPDSVFEKNYRLQDIQLSKIPPSSLARLRRGKPLTRLTDVVACPAEARSRASSGGRRLVENTGLEPVTSWLQTRRSPS